MYVHQQLTMHANLQPNKRITTFQGRQTTYREFYEQACNLAAFFQAKGYEKEDRIAVYLMNSDTFLICYYACQLGGFTFVPINTKLAPPEVEYIIHHSEARALIYDTRFLANLESIDLTTIDTQLSRGQTNSLESILTCHLNEYQPVHLEDDDTTVIFYTSGTTGKPKGVMLTARNVEAVAEIWSEAMDLTAEDHIQIVTPLFHCAASHVFSIPVIYKGGSLVIEETFIPEQAMTTLEQEQVTIFFGVPAMYTVLLNMKRLPTLNLSHLRMFTYGAAPMPYELIKRIKALFPNVAVQNLYGQTENAPAATTLKDHYALAKIGSVGEVLPKTAIKVVDQDGNPVAAGEVGEIIVRGPQVMKGYLKNEAETAKALREGWLYSGDLGRLDADGLLYIVDRKKDMIIRGGENVYPVEVEEVLYQIPSVLEAAVVGVPHPVYGEVPKAFIVVKEGQQLAESDVINACQSQLAKYKWPVEIHFLDALPRNASGKVLKNHLRVTENVNM